MNIIDALKNRDIDAIQEFLDICDGKRKDIDQSNLPLNRQVDHVEFASYGDWIYYKDGHKEWRSIGD